MERERDRLANYNFRMTIFLTKKIRKDDAEKNQQKCEKQLKSLKRQINTIENEIDELQNQITELEKELREIGRSRTRNSSNKDFLAQKIHSLESHEGISNGIIVFKCTNARAPICIF